MRAKSYKRDPRLETPKTITLPDGREIATAELLIKPTNRRSYNLRTGMEFGEKTKRKIAKPIDTQTKE